MFGVLCERWEEFVLRHIDATDAANDLKEMARNARRHCPAKSTRLCRMIESAAQRALREINTDTK